MNVRAYKNTGVHCTFRNLLEHLTDGDVTVRGDQESIQLSGAYATRQQAEEGEKEEVLSLIK